LGAAFSDGAELVVQLHGTPTVDRLLPYLENKTTRFETTRFEIV
jgi:hypothetical protein